MTNMETEDGVVIGGTEPESPGAPNTLPTTQEQPTPEKTNSPTSLPTSPSLDPAPSPEAPAETQQTLRGKSVKQKKAKIRKAKKKHTTKRFRLSQFDKDLLELVAAGRTSEQELLNILLVAPAEFVSRVKQLKRKNYFSKEKTEGVLRLGIDGYNFLREKELKGKATRKTRTASEFERQEAERKMLPSELVESRGNLCVVPPTRIEIEPVEAKEPEFDLGAALKRGKPFPNQSRSKLYKVVKLLLHLYMQLYDPSCLHKIQCNHPHDY